MIKLLMLTLTLITAPIICNASVQAPQQQQGQPAAQIITINGNQAGQASRPSTPGQELSFQTWLGLSLFYAAYFEPEKLIANPLLFSQEGLLLAGSIYLGSCAYNHWDYYQNNLNQAISFGKQRAIDLYKLTHATVTLGHQSVSSLVNIAQAVIAYGRALRQTPAIMPNLGNTTMLENTNAPGNTQSGNQ